MTGIIPLDQFVTMNTTVQIRGRNIMAVKFVNGFKTFSESKGLFKGTFGISVLENFSMNVPSGCIYSLLGSSGCGKTTVLSCLLGLCRLDSGYVSISPSILSHGYMPQETSLYAQFTIFETLHYFGTLMSTSVMVTNGRYSLRKQIEVLSKLLVLPSGKRLVATLSGGQKRRVSLAVALLNEPHLLLLDEPTAGLDPLLREIVWKHLSYLAATKKTTIILTTHYVDEAKNSSVVGIMRNGRMIAEDKPSNLLRVHQVHSMESLFLSLCKQHDIPEETPIPFQLPTSIKAVNMSSLISNKDYNIHKSVKRVSALIVKNYKVMFRNLWMLLFITTVPAFSMLITCLALQNDPHGIAMGLVNDDLRGFQICPKAVLTVERFCRAEHLSCIFLESLPDDQIHLINFKTKEMAVQAVKSGQIWGLIHFPENYTSEVTNRALMGPSYFNNDKFDNSKITVNLDQTNTIIYANILTTLYHTLEKSSKTMLGDCGYDERIGEFPLQYNKPIIGEQSITSLIYIAPSLAIGILYFFPLTVSIRFITEKRQGTFERCIAGCTRSWEILISYAITEFTLLIFQSILVISILHFGFSLISCLSNLRFVLALCLLQGLSGLTSGLLLALFLNEESQAAMAIIAIVFPSAFLSGLLWPREGMPQVLQKISPLLPMTLPAESMRSLITRCWEIDHPNVWQGFLVNLVYIVGSFILTMLLLNRRVQK